ncbi:MAG: O-antigen ligase family protein [Bacteroidales bacterium]|nr:O-antigen ligase family protein [Bacteroidales bacterium]
MVTEICSQEKERTRLLGQYLTCLFFILATDATICRLIFGAGGTGVIFLILSIWVTGGNFPMNESFVYVVFYCLLQFISFIYNDGNINETTWLLRDILLIVATFYYISNSYFYQFRTVFTNVVFLLCLIGIPIFVLSEFGLLPIHTTIIGDHSYLFFGIYILGWDILFHRFSGIFHEPGAWQILLNIALWFNFDRMISNNKIDAMLKFKLVVIILSLLISFSTGGYIAFAIFILAFFLKKKWVGKYSLLLYFFSIVFLIGILLMLFNSGVVQDKLFNYHVSTTTRTDDINACFRIASEHPLIGCGNKTRIFNEKSLAYGNRTSSAGIVAYTAMLGFVWLFVYIFVLWKTVKVMYNEIITRLLFIIAFITLNMNEAITYAPLVNVFLIRFKSESNKKN